MTDLAKVATWFAGEDTGVSSNTIAAFMCGANMRKVYKMTPSDPADLGRCLRLIEQFPEWKPRIPELASLGKNWGILAQNWDALALSMEAECGIHLEKGRSAPKTYDLMKAIGL
jgi:hypothetical protein